MLSDFVIYIHLRKKGKGILLHARIFYVIPKTFQSKLLKQDRQNIRKFLTVSPNGFKVVTDLL